MKLSSAILGAAIIALAILLSNPVAMGLRKVGVPINV